jgi:hypothetical protein
MRRTVEFLVIETLLHENNGRVLWISPSRALQEISRFLLVTLVEKIGHSTAANIPIGELQVMAEHSGTSLAVNGPILSGHEPRVERLDLHPRECLGALYRFLFSTRARLRVVLWNKSITVVFL